MRLVSSDKSPTIGEVIKRYDNYYVWDGDDWVRVKDPQKGRVKSMIKEFENDPKLFNEIMVEMRNRKINKIKNG